MMKEFAKYMRYGKTVEDLRSNVVYSLVEDMDGNKETVTAVRKDNLERFRLLLAWERNWDGNSMGFRERFTQDIEECKAERQGYIETLDIDGLAPYDTIRFITPHYETKFTVRDLSRVFVDGLAERVNGVAARVAFLDECHFTFADSIGMKLYGGCLHICQFAEICEKNGLTVEMVDEPYLFQLQE